MIKKNICLIFHCLRDSKSLPNEIHPEMFVEKDEVENLILQLIADGFVFKLPRDALKGEKVCTFTLDDGYANNVLFLDLAKKYKIPFILFINSYNIINQSFFAWDVYVHKYKRMYPISRFDYLNFYKEFNSSECNVTIPKNYRPFSLDGLHRFLDNDYAHLGLHSHCHQPYVGDYLQVCLEDLETNREFVKKFNNHLTDEFALPCGLYTKKTISKLLKKCQYIYTTDGGGFSSQDLVVSRTSLINSNVGGELYGQIQSSFNPLKKIRRKLAIAKHSNPRFF
jgi:peptidoglycan/xylan/chitin deacetylase (PgdA/CDA1 family)